MEFIIQKTIEAVQTLYNQTITASDISLQETRKEFAGDITVVVFAFTRFSKKSPDVTGQEIGEYLKQNVAEIADFNVIKGFLNIVIDDSFWINRYKVNAATPNFGVSASNGKKVMVEYSSPNTNKPLHLGHVRNNLLGYSVAEIIEAAGYEVIKANLVNDRGIHICKSMLAWQKFGNGETPASSGMKGDHLVGKYYVIFDKEYKKEIDILKEQGVSEDDAKKQAPLMVETQQMLQKWEEGDTDVINLWKMMNGWVYEGFDVTYKNLGVNFDKYYYESNTYLLGKDLIEEGLAKGVFFRKPDSSVWIDLTADGLDEKLVLRSDGTSVYMTQDLGTAELKYNDFQMDKSVYVVGNEQDYHFKVLFLILDKLGKSWAKGLFHLSYGMVDLPSGKMKSREGTVVDADDLVQEMIDTAAQHTEELGKVDDFSETEKTELFRQIGLGALKYHLLKVDPKKRIMFDPNESIDFQGHTGPFIQYSYARIRSVIRKSEGIEFTNVIPTVLTKDERELIQQLDKFPIIIADAAESYSPAIIANYLYEVAKGYNKFYHETPILKAEDEQLKKSRLGLSSLTADVLQKGMALLGIEVPERM
ncbi:arginine--tRNA ligase [Solitalea canadensis]|uniref:Arginine--tRNA ligase n=1 Tax=Solitalea canadensis (strain ATCC 29591 / DSM 3403 / JCM 21819 / LMG 8368 / NBRC 15130 / NCIMB 12057 / USAM 9D) TaxID=929556 RepID=H8KQX3_SOLCM|nr:arginine--tRNA ligase [Solitalea canadensis]AFD07119.1 arginyl-tRNA synthetase [Solitalea canadensis DSM 3403]